MDILPPWLAVIVISRDLIIVLGIADCFIADREVQIAPSLAGKTATTVQILTVFVILLAHEYSRPFLDHYAIYLYYLTALITVVSGLQYVYIGLNTPSKTPIPPDKAE
jgi:cardiolipin synthase (CMP-forming)